MLVALLRHLDVFCFQNFVDLAGSERASENAGERLREGCSINRSLLMLSRVIYKLSESDSWYDIDEHLSYFDPI